jgi:hypothetical protein
MSQLQAFSWKAKSFRLRRKEVNGFHQAIVHFQMVGDWTQKDLFTKSSLDSILGPLSESGQGLWGHFDQIPWMKGLVLEGNLLSIEEKGSMGDPLTGRKGGSRKVQPIERDIQSSLQEREERTFRTGRPVFGPKPFFSQPSIIRLQSLLGPTTVDIEVLFGLQPRNSVGRKRGRENKGVLLKVFPLGLSRVMNLWGGPEVNSELLANFDFLFIHEGSQRVGERGQIDPRPKLFG